ncbi:MAG TPA: hypothetical protein VGL34_10090 [Steroidobacteraceae bacterium]|jgi:hypothetical protein
MADEAVAAKKAFVDATDANVKQLEAMESSNRSSHRSTVSNVTQYRRRRLINAGSAAGQELFEVSDLHRLPIYVQVTQAFNAVLCPGLTATFPDAAISRPELRRNARHYIERNDCNLAQHAHRAMADNPDGRLFGGTI